MSAYRHDFDETKYASFLIKDNKLLEKYIEIWEKVSNTFKKEFDSHLAYNKEYLRTKIKSDNGKISTNFQNNKIPKEDTNLFVFRQSQLILFLEWVKTIILK